MLTDKRDRNIINLKHTKIMSDEISKEEIKSEFLKTAGSFAEYMMKEYEQPKDGRSMLLIASDDDKSLVSFIGKKIDGCKSIVNVMLTNDDIDELLNVSCSSAKMMRNGGDYKSLNECFSDTKKMVDDFLEKLKNMGGEKDE